MVAKKDACLAQSERKGWRGRLVGEAGACTRFGRLARRTKREGSHLGQMEQRGIGQCRAGPRWFHVALVQAGSLQAPLLRIQILP